MQFAFRQNGATHDSRQAQALRYYQEVFGLKIVQEDEKWAELSSGRCRLTVYKGNPLDVESEKSPLEKGDTPKEADAPEECSGRWQRDPFGFAFRWTLLREQNAENSCYQSANRAS